MTISGAYGVSGLEAYRISSIQGNPVSLQPVNRLTEQAQQRNKPLVIAQKKQEDLYVKEYGAYQQTTSTAVGDFADILSMQGANEDESGQGQRISSYEDYLKDTIGVMGYKMQLRSQLGIETVQ